MTTASLYVSRNLLNGGEVARHFAGQGLRSTLAPDEMHVTVLYSKKPLRWESVPPATDGLVFPPMRGARGVGVHAVDRHMKKMGEHGMLAMVVSPQNEGAKSVVERHNTYREAGASHDYSDVTVHVMVSYACGDIDVSKVKPFPGELRFGPEIRKPIEKDWTPDLTKERPAVKAVTAGHRDNPVRIAVPGDLDRAALHSWDPTPAQAEAGNYRKTHALLGEPPLEVAIETPLGRTRSGVGPDGVPWFVTMLCHYGYVKKTNGADGDEIDVYVGPQAHATHMHTVYVVDQADAETGVFDEHKCLLGFSDGRDAARTYMAAFSDGKGHLRVGGVTRMTYAAFRAWLSGGDTVRPLAMVDVAKADIMIPALGCGCGATHAACRCQTGGSGEPMTTVPYADPAPQGAGYLTKAIGALWGRMSATERTEMLKDAATASTLTLGKASEALEHADSGSRIKQVEDLFDGPPDDELETVMAHGPDSSVAAGKVNIGPSQASTGGDAPRMESQYSRHATQTGVQRATEMLGRKVAGHHTAMKGFIAFGKAMADRLTLLETSSLTPPAPGASQIDPALLKAEIAKALPAAVALALAKAIPDVVRTIAKAKKMEEGEHDEEEGEDDDDEGREAEAKAATAKSEAESDAEEEGEDKDEKDEVKKAQAYAAAQERVVAKALTRLAKKAAQDAEDSMKDGMHHAGARHHGMASKRMHKAQTHLAVAKSLQDGRVGASTKAVEASIEAVAKALKKTKTENQDKWPNKGGEVGKSTTVPAVAAAVPAAGDAPGAASAEQITKAMTTIEKAMSGMALLQADVQQVMNLVGGQSRNPADGGMPPVAALFKSDTDGSKEARIAILAQNGVIGMADRDKGMDAVATMKVPGMPQGAIEATIASCAPQVQAVLRSAA